MDTLSKLSHTLIAQQTGLRYVELMHYIVYHDHNNTAEHVMLDV